MLKSKVIQIINKTLQIDEATVEHIDRLLREAGYRPSGLGYAAKGFTEEQFYRLFLACLVVDRHPAKAVDWLIAYQDLPALSPYCPELLVPTPQFSAKTLLQAIEQLRNVCAGGLENPFFKAWNEGKTKPIFFSLIIDMGRCYAEVVVTDRSATNPAGIDYFRLPFSADGQIAPVSSVSKSVHVTQFIFSRLAELMV